MTDWKMFRQNMRAEDYEVVITDLEDFLLRHGYRRCDIPACNCNSWHGGHANERLKEIGDYLQSVGMWRGTILESIKWVFRNYGIDDDDEEN